MQFDVKIKQTLLGIRIRKRKKIDVEEIMDELIVDSFKRYEKNI